MRKRRRRHLAIHQTPEQAAHVAELEQRLLEVQRSTATTWPIFLPLHNWLRMHSKLYYKWHTKQYASRLNAVAVVVLIIVAALLVAAMVLTVFFFNLYLSSHDFMVVGHEVKSALISPAP